MREIGISPRFSRDKFVPLQTKQRYSTRDISSEVFLTLFFRGFVPFLSLADFVSREKNLQVVDLQRLKSCFGELVTATTSNHQTGPHGQSHALSRLHQPLPLSAPNLRQKEVKRRYFQATYQPVISQGATTLSDDRLPL